MTKLSLCLPALALLIAGCPAPEEQSDCDTGEVPETFYVDVDGDGVGVAGDSVNACAMPEGYSRRSDDCDDTVAENWPGNIEVCDGIDNNCDAQVDEPGTQDAPTWYVDADGDGYGDATYTLDQCEAPSGYADNPDDCDDTDPAANPAGDEGSDAGDGLDSDCDGAVDEGTLSFDDDFDGYSEDAGDCDDASASASPDAVERLDGVDNDCDSAIDRIGLGAWSGQGVRYTGEASGDEAGEPVFGAGDLDGDGKDEIVIAARGANEGKGSVYVLYSGDLEIGDEVELGDGTMLTLDGDEEDGALGQGLAAGDLTGDGYADLIVGAMYANEDEGEVYVIPGPVDLTGAQIAGQLAPIVLVGAGAVGDGGEDTGLGGAPITGEDEFFGGALSIGQVNTTGQADLLVGARNAADAAGDRMGRAYLFHGPVTGDTPAGMLFHGEQADAFTGFEVLLADVDSDGVDDALIGAQGLDVDLGSGEEDLVGCVYAVAGVEGVEGERDLAWDADYKLVGAYGGGYAGQRFAAGDVDGDGHQDLLVAAPGSVQTYGTGGKLYLVPGPADTWTGSLSDASATVEHSGVNFARAAVIAADMDGDNAADLLFPCTDCDADLNDGSDDDLGATFLYLSGTLSGTIGLDSADAVIYGEAAGDRAGAGLSVADPDGDGDPDLLIGSDQSVGDAVGLTHLLLNGL